MASRGQYSWFVATVVTLVALFASMDSALAHPMGNFSISHYGALRVERDGIQLRYVLDMAEIPTFQEIQAAGIVAEAGHSSLPLYLARMSDTLKRGLRLELDGRPLPLTAESSDVIFPPGAGGLPTLKIGIVYRAPLEGAARAGTHHLAYHDDNFPDRAGWKEVVATGASGVALTESSVPETDRSHQLADYPTDLLNSPPQDLVAHLVFTDAPAPTGVARAAAPIPLASTRRPRPTPITRPALPAAPSATAAAPGDATRDAIRLQANRHATPRSAFAELITTRELGLGVVLAAMAVAASLGAFHALEPGHGKTVVAAYLVGSRGTARHALLLGLIVTAAHTAGVYLLGGVTLYASRSVVPERLYPWLGVASGLTIAALGVILFLRRYGGAADGHPRPHRHDHHDHHHDHGVSHHRGLEESAGPRHDVPGLGDHHGAPRETVTLRALFALGITGGIVPCPAALVVLLSAVALRRIGFGLLLIVAFSLGLAGVLIAIGLLMVYARRFMGRFHSEGRVVTRWLPLTSALVITLSGVAIALQALTAAGVLTFRL